VERGDDIESGIDHALRDLVEGECALAENLGLFFRLQRSACLPDRGGLRAAGPPMSIASGAISWRAGRKRSEFLVGEPDSAPRR